MPTTRPKRGPPKPSATAYAPSSIFKAISPLTKPNVDLHAFLVSCLTSWSTYTLSEQQQIISSLPPSYRPTDSSSLEFPLGLDVINSDTHIKDSIEKFRRDLAEGYFDPTWRRNAASAMRERVEGKFNEYIREKVELDFGDIVGEEHDGEEESENDKEWGADKGKGVGKGEKGKKGKGRGKGRATRGKMQSLSGELEE